MTEPNEQTGPTGPTGPGETAWQRKRRLAEIFGDGEQAVTSDELPDPAPKGDESATDRWLKDQVPPHHGGE